jgi:hypothetical protein
MESTVNSNLSNGTNSEILSIYEYINNILLNPTIVIILVIVVVIYLFLFMSLGKNNSSDSYSNSESLSQPQNSTSNLVWVIIISLFIVLAIINGLQYFFGLNIIAKIKNLFSNNPQIDIAVIEPKSLLPSPIPEIKLQPQVFNIPGNKYDYQDAKALCSAYGARLANYQELEKTYNTGGEWCNYGWSEGQMALFPTQKKTYDNLQKIEGHENDCGRPGINGGYMANPKIKFGVNCYGHKPKITEQEEALMEIATPYPETAQDLEFQKRVDYWKNKVDEILVSPFNYNMWGSSAL